MFSIKSVYITVPHESHNTILCVSSNLAHVALTVTETYQIQINDENTCIHSYPDKVTIITVKKMVYSAYYT